MHVTAALPTRLLRDRREPHGTRARTAVLQTLARARRSGGPEDRALYSCHCGYAFQAEVSTSVSCPHCGSNHAW
jgi:predicted Zn-ribbon and HTH transcriptional regulator